MLFAVEGRFETAAWLIFGALLADLVDGALARATGSVSRFGIELDSLADVVSFGIAPAFLAALRFDLVKHPFWLFPLFYAACSAVRLARYNVEAREHLASGAGKVAATLFFRGTPIPAPASVILGLVLFLESYPASIPRAAVVLLLFLLGYLAVSNVRYPAPKVLFTRRHPFPVLVIVLLTCLLLAYQFVETWMVLCVLYYLTGPVRGLARAFGVSPQEVAEQVTEEGGVG